MDDQGGSMAARDFRIALKTRREIDYEDPVFASEEYLEGMYEQAKAIAHHYNSAQKKMENEAFVSAAKLHATGILHLLYQTVVSRYLTDQDHDFFTRLTPQITRNHSCQDVLGFFAREFPSPLLNKTRPTAPFLMEETTRGFFIHQVMLENPALSKAAKPFIKPDGIRFPPASIALTALMGGYTKSAPGVGDYDEDLFSFLTGPAKAHPDSLTAQIGYILRKWKDLIPDTLKTHLLRAVDYVQEEEKPRFQGGGPGPMEVVSYGSLDMEYEAYSSDRNWMPNVVLIAKSTLVWLDQLSRYYGYPIETLDKIPDRELDLLAERGFTGLWLIGLWERSNASKKIKNLCGNPEAEASAYSLKGYDIATSIGGWSALKQLDEKCKARGIRLASDMVPNHTGLDSDWALHHPEYFIHSPFPPFPSYTYNGENLSPDPRIEIKIEDHYFDRTDAAVTFRRRDLHTQETTFIFHGNDGTSMPWNDTAQLDFLNQHTREAVIQQILHVARNFHIIRFDAAMTLAKRHIQRLWYPRPGSGGDIPGRAEAGLSDEEFARMMPQEFWREVVDRVANEVPDTLLLAEAFWMMEGYFVRTLGMHRVYNSAFMNMLKNQENKKYIDTIKNTLAFDPEILKRFVNFMNNPDEETAVAQFGNGDKYFGVCTLLSTMPGLPMFGHGQIEGFREKYGMEYRRAYWNEFPDDHLVAEHYRRIFPLLKLRHAFSGVDFFDLFDVVDGHSAAEAVFAYVNGTRDRRALVLYNNRYEHSQGRIFTSAPKLVRLPDGGRATRTRSLGESLGLTVGGRRYMLYESFPDRLTYIVPSMTIFDEGLWVSLNGYETRIMLNIREVEDHDGTFDALYHFLEGKGSANLERDLAAIRLRPVFQALDNFRSPFMVDTVRDITNGNKVKTKDMKKFLLMAGESYARISALYESLPSTTSDMIPSPAGEVQPKDLLREVQTLVECFDRSRKGSPIYLGGKVMDELPLIVLTSLILKSFLHHDTAMHEAGAIYSNLLMGKFFTDHVHGLGVDEMGLENLLRKAIFLALDIKEVKLTLNESSPDPKRCLQRLFDSPEFKRSVEFNEYQQIQWYNKEAFQDTVYLLSLGACVHNENDVYDSIGRLLSSWLEADLKAEYKVENLLGEVN
jgi:glycosidase